MSRRKLAGGWIDQRDHSKGYRLPYRRPDDGRQTSRTFSTKGEASAFYDDLQHGRKAGTWVAPDAGRELLVSFAEEWAEGQDWAPSTRDTFSHHLKRIERHLGPRRLDGVDELALGKLRRSLLESYAPSTATVTLHYASAVMRAAYRTRRVPRDVTESIAPPRNRSGRNEGVGPDNIPTRAEVVAIMDAAPAGWRAAISLGASGLRVSEVLGIHAEQYDRAGRVLVVDRQLQRINGVDSFPLPKREKVRRIVLPEWASADLETHLDEYQGGGHIFRGRTGLPRRRDRFYTAVWHPSLVAAGLAQDAYVFHSLRHWCASAMLADGAPLSAVAGHLGDTIETVSRTYAHWLRDDREVPAAVLTRMLRPELRIVQSEAIVTEA